MKTFNDLKFEKHPLAESGFDSYASAKSAYLEFDNEYGVSVLIGSAFYSNGIDTYELAVLFNGEITYNTEITDNVLGHLKADEVTDVMLRVQSLKY